MMDVMDMMDLHKWAWTHGHMDMHLDMHTWTHGHMDTWSWTWICLCGHEIWLVDGGGEGKKWVISRHGAMVVHQWKLRGHAHMTHGHGRGREGGSCSARRGIAMGNAHMVWIDCVWDAVLTVVARVMKGPAAETRGLLRRTRPNTPDHTTQAWGNTPHSPSEHGTGLQEHGTATQRDRE